MIRVIFFFIFLSICVGFGLWISGQPGSFIISWGDYEFQSHLGLFFTFLLLLVILFSSIWLFIRWLWKIPSILKHALKVKAYKKSFKLFVQSLEAYSSKDFSTAFKKIRAIPSRIKDPGLFFWLESKIAKESNDLKLSIECCNHVIESPSSAFLGYHQLIKIAFKQRNYDKALSYLNKAQELYKNNPWVLKQSIKIYLKQSNWNPIHRSLKNLSAKTEEEEIEKNLLYAILTYKQALDKNITTGAEKLKLLLYAINYDPGFIPAIESYAKTLQENKKDAHYQKLLEKTWKIKPSLNVANLYIESHLKEQPIERFKAAQYLLKLAPYSTESYLIVIQSAIDANLKGEAKAFLKRALDKNIFPENAFFVKVLKACLQKESYLAHENLWIFLRQSFEKNEWQCTECDYFQEEWFIECPSCQSLLQYKLKSIF